MLLAIKASNYELMIGARISAHRLFGAIFEYKHSHNYRAKVPFLVVPVMTAIGISFYWHIESAGYILTSYLYTKKTKKLGWFSPFARALQNFFIVAGIIGYASYLTLLIPVIFFLRNVLGDFRDTTKDRSEGLRTIPVMLGFSKSYKHIHLIGLLATSAVWLVIGGFNLFWLVPIYIVEIGTYNLTSR